MQFLYNIHSITGHIFHNDYSLFFFIGNQKKIILILILVLLLKHLFIRYLISSIKQFNIKNPTYYFFNNVINIKNFDSNLLKIDKKSYKNIDIYYIGYITIKDIDYVNINSVLLLIKQMDTLRRAIEINI